MNLATTTDVLTFEIQNVKGETTMGEIVISLDFAAGEAKKRKVPLFHEVVLLVVHGLLHLAGFNDKTQKTWSLMKQREAEWLAEMLNN